MTECTAAILMSLLYGTIGGLIGSLLVLYWRSKQADKKREDWLKLEREKRLQPE